MLTTFFNSRGNIHKEFVPLGRRVNAEYCKVVLDRLLKRMLQIRPELYESSDRFLLHDNAPSHNAALIREFLAKKKAIVLHPLPYSPIWLRLTIFCYPNSKVN